MGPELLIPIFAVVGFFATNILLIYMFFSSRHKERMALLERDKDASIFHANGIADALKFGMVAIMIGVGILLGYLLVQMGMPEEIAYFSMILILGGLGLLAYYFYASRNQKFIKSDEEMV
ncbi:MAG: hypothetical protein MRY78_12490 [Saprospiraceae bacterium]|nr:hypothetical protein [Saprospiraceae bacterium]